MRKIAFFFLFFLLISTSENYSQINSGADKDSEPFSIEINLWKPLVFGGFVQVREWSYMGTKYFLNETLGLNSLESVDFTFSFPVASNHKLSLTLGRYFFQGEQVLFKNGYFNGTELKANTVASIDASRYVRIMLLDNMTLSKTNDEILQLVFGISIDAIRFYINAPFTEDTPRKETFEGFDKQVVPVPIIGLSWNKSLGNETVLKTFLRGGTWPGLDTWYQEEGTIRLWQYNLEADAGITKKFGSIESELNFAYRLIYIKGESREDTNEILIHGFGPELTLSYIF